MRWGMLCYEVPLRRYPDTYNGEPLCYVGLAARKNGFSLYLMGAHADPGQARALKDAYRKAGKKLDMGKSCLRFERLEDLETDAVAKVIASTPPEAMIAFAETARRH